MNITDNFYLVTQKDNSVKATLFNSEEWLMIIQKVLKLLGKFVEKAFRNNSQYSEHRRTLGQYVFDFLLPGNTTTERRMLAPIAELEVECLPFMFNSKEPCFWGKKIAEKELEKDFFERWLILTMKGWMLLVDINYDRRKKGEPGSFKLGYEEVVTKISYCLNGEEHQQQFRERLLPYLDYGLAHDILRYAPDIFNFDFYRRKKEAKEFSEAYDFWKMVMARISFPS